MVQTELPDPQIQKFYVHYITVYKRETVTTHILTIHLIEIGYNNISSDT